MSQLPAAAFAADTRYFTLLFVRQESAEVTAAALVQGRTRHADNAAVLQAIRSVLSAWVATTEEGRQAWDASAADLNIGDVLSSDILDIAAVADALATQGVWVSDGAASLVDDMLAYDLVLADGPGDAED